MDTLLDRLAKQLWVPWLTCIGVGVAGVAFDDAGYKDLALVFNLVAPFGVMIVGFNFLSWSSREREALARAKPRNVRYARDWNLLALTLLSFLSMTAVYAFGLPHDLIMPLFASMMIPMLLMSRSAVIARLS